MARGSGGESVLHKHLRLLEAFDVHHPFLTLSEIAESAGLSPSTAHRLVAQLTEEGLLERLPDRSYRLGIRLWEFASRTPGALGLREVARPWMEVVHEHVRQHAQLGVLSGTDVLFVERMSTKDAVINATLIGGRIPLALSSSGLVLLAHASPAVRDEVVRTGWPRPTALSYRGEKDLRDGLRRVRAQGYAVMDGHVHADSRGVAVPVHGPRHGVYAALGVVVANDGRSPHRLVELLSVAAAGITRALEDASLPDGGASTRHEPRAIQPLISTSARTLAYFAGLGVDPAKVRD
jgi:DNA-binding IclR family transcriptional regulator